MAAFTKDGLRVVKARGRIANLEEKIKEEGGDMYCTCGIGHTRWATHGEPSDRNLHHPHLGGEAKVAVVHNGIIENYKELRASGGTRLRVLSPRPIRETVAHLVDYLHTGKQEDLAKTVLQAVQRLRGSYALGVVSMDNTQEIVAARRGNPLVIGIGEGENMIASDITAIINRTKRYIILDDNEVAIVRPDSVVVMNEFGDTVEKEIMTVTWDMSAAEKGGYQHFMLKEIMEQPKAVADTVKPRIKNDAVVFEDNGLTDERLREIEHIHIIGCGSALHAGMVGKRVIEAMCRIRCTAEVASEFRYENPIIGKKDMHRYQPVRRDGGYAGCHASGQAGRCVHDCDRKRRFLDDCARSRRCAVWFWLPEISVATTKAYSAQLSALYLISVKIARVRGLISIGDERALCAGAPAPAGVHRADPGKCQSDMQRIATLYANRSSVFFLGRGLDAAALEASLKLKEISYIHSRRTLPVSFKHGTISLIEEGTSGCCLATQLALFEKTVSNIREVVARG